VTGPLTPHVIAATATNRRSQFNSDWRSRMGGERTTIPEVSCNVYLDTCQMSRIIGNFPGEAFTGLCSTNANSSSFRVGRHPVRFTCKFSLRVWRTFVFATTSVRLLNIREGSFEANLACMRLLRRR
jgi:hypothetical protein